MITGLHGCAKNGRGRTTDSTMVGERVEGAYTSHPMIFKVSIFLLKPTRCFPAGASAFIRLPGVWTAYLELGKPGPRSAKASMAKYTRRGEDLDHPECHIEEIGLSVGNVYPLRPHIQEINDP